jgi:TonB family protein
MSGIRSAGRAFCVLLFMTGVARADLGAAQKAYAAQDYVRAFELYREIAELGNLVGQENLAAMYVDGQGVKRDNVLGYAWAVIARENGGSAAMQSIIDQLQPHLNDAARARVAEVTSKFGKAALQETLLPSAVPPPKTDAQENCRYTKPANPDDYYPPEAVRQEVSGFAFVEAMILPDGRAHRPHVWYSLPTGVFDEAARQTTLASEFAPKTVNGTAVPCAIRFKIKYVAHRAWEKADADLATAMANAKTRAEAGDSAAAALYGLLLFGRPPKDASDKKPLDWYLQAAQAGIPSAQFLVGIDLMKLDPSAPAAEVAKGRAWLTKAATAQQVDAQFALANYALVNEPGASSDPQVITWLDNSAKAGHHDGIVYLAALLAAGPDVAHRDPARALTLLHGVEKQITWDITALEVAAAAHAQLGNFDDAQREQELAIKNAHKLRWDETAMQARLRLYQAKQTWTGNLIPN